MKRLALTLAVLLLVNTVAPSLSVWCQSGVCEPAANEPAINVHDCCVEAVAVDHAGERDTCLDCVSVDDHAPAIPDRPFSPASAVVFAYLSPALPLALIATSDEIPVLPTGPPIASASLRELRTVRLLI